MFKHLFRVAFRPDEVPGGGEPAPVAAVAPPESPWSTDLAGLGLEGESLTRVDGYLKERWQPRMTQYEQQVAELAPARELWQDFNSNPADTFLAVGSALFGDEVGAELSRLLTVEEQPPDPAAPQPEGLDPRVQALLDQHEEQQRQQAYAEGLASVKTKATEVPVEEDLFHPFVIAAGGDFDAALQAYTAWAKEGLKKFGAPAAEVPDPAAIPATLGTGSAGSAAAPPPVAVQHRTLDDALDATLAEMRAARQAPAVGTV